MPTQKVGSKVERPRLSDLQGGYMNKLFMSFVIFLFGIMAGYGWSHYHQNTAVMNLKQEIRENQKYIDSLQNSIHLMERELEIEDIVQKIIACESSHRYDVWGDGGKSFGPAQFQQRTFKWMKLQAGKPYLQWKNPKHQIYLLKWALQNGHERHWLNCYRKIYANG